MKRAVITGASGGIGADFARLVAQKKMNIFLVARRKEELDALAAVLRAQYNVQVETLSLDLSLPEASEILFREATKDGKQVDLLINNAGIGPWRFFMNASIDDHKKLMQLNMVTLTTNTHLFAQHMLAHKSPSLILNVASVAAFQPAPRYTIYAPSKAYVKMFSEILNEELKATNVRISCLCPGGTATEFLKNNNLSLKSSFSPLMSSEKVARIGLEKALAGKTLIIPGLVNKFFAFFPRLLPSSWMVKIAGWGMNLAVKQTKN
ncbi:MAG: SDR family NAD(P)-dependent oxidoreductase [Bacteriovoracaceae bacterium]